MLEAHSPGESDLVSKKFEYEEWEKKKTIKSIDHDWAAMLCDKVRVEFEWKIRRV